MTEPREVDFGVLMRRWRSIPEAEFPLCITPEELKRTRQRVSRILEGEQVKGAGDRCPGCGAEALLSFGPCRRATWVSPGRHFCGCCEACRRRAGCAAKVAAAPAREVQEGTMGVPTDEEIKAFLARRPLHQPNPLACRCWRCREARETYRRLFDLYAGGAVDFLHWEVGLPSPVGDTVYETEKEEPKP